MSKLLNEWRFLQRIWYFGAARPHRGSVLPDRGSQTAFFRSVNHSNIAIGIVVGLEQTGYGQLVHVVVEWKKQGEAYKKQDAEPQVIPANNIICGIPVGIDELLTHNHAAVRKAARHRLELRGAEALL